jgi:TonB family protein
MCFLVLAGLHILIPALFPFSPAARRKLPVEELSLTFESFTAPVFPVEEVVPPAAESPAPPLEETALPELPAEAVPEAVETSGWETPVPSAVITETAVSAGAPASAVPVPAGSPAPARAAFGQADYLALIMRRLEEKKIYPLSVRKRGIEGDVTVDFIIGPNGEAAGITLADSDHRFLGQAAIETIRAASPFPLMAGMNYQEMNYPVRVTIRYRLEEK